MEQSHSNDDFTTQAANYEHGSDIQKTVELKMIEMLALEKGSTVLDLGCGIGYLTKVLSEKVGPEGKVVAVDPDGERLKIAREKHSASNIDYIQADHQAFPEGQYDIIFSNIVINWISDKKALLKWVYESLSVGGRFAFTAHMQFLKLEGSFFDNLVGPSFLQETFYEKMIFLNEDQYMALATDIGFTVMSMSKLPTYPMWKNVDDYLESMHGWRHGGFNLSHFDRDALDDLIRKDGNGPIMQLEPIWTIHAILTEAK